MGTLGAGGDARPSLLLVEELICFVNPWMSGRRGRVGSVDQFVSQWVWFI